MVGDTDVDGVVSGLKGLSPQHHLFQIITLHYDLRHLTCPILRGLPGARLGWIASVGDEQGYAVTVQSRFKSSTQTLESLISVRMEFSGDGMRRPLPRERPYLV